MTYQDQSSAAGDGAASQRYALPKPQVRIKSYRLQFSGTGAQYFRVWFVNVLLSILTLGLFTPWARKRTAEYFFSHSVIARSPLEFTASIKRMVIGFFICLGLYALFDYATGSANLLVVGLALGCVAVAIPFLWGSSKRFRITATRWRGLRLRFGTNWKEIYWASWPVFLAAACWFFTYAGIDMIRAFTPPSLIAERAPATWLGLSKGPWILIGLSLLVTWLCAVRVLYNYQRLLFERTYLGIERGVFRARYADFIKIWMVTTLIAMAGAVVVVKGIGYWVGGQDAAAQWLSWLADDGEPGIDWEQEPLLDEEIDSEQEGANRQEDSGYDSAIADGPTAEDFGDIYQSIMGYLLVFFLVVIVALLTVLEVALSYREAKQHRLIWNTSGLSDIARFRCRLSVPGFMWLRLQNWLLTMLTLGFYRPFARVRAYRAKWDSVTVHVRGGVSQVRSLLVIQQEGGAFADAIADFAGFDIVT